MLLCDDWASYEPALAELGARGLHFTAKITTLSKMTSEAHLVHPHVHRVASLLKRWLLGTHQGGVADQHLDSYLDEFVFRFNRHNSRNRGLVFWRLICALVETRAPIGYQDLRGRAADLAVADRAHADRVRVRRNAAEAIRERERRHSHAEAEGRTVRKYERSPTTEADDPSPAST